MNKELLKKIIIEYQEFISGIKIIPREYKVDPAGNYIIIGPRRAGKTYLLYQVIQDLIKKNDNREQVLYINFEDERLMELRAENLDMIIEAYRELYAKEPILFFDEIQNINGWAKFLRRLADQKYRIYVTGSNAKLTSSEMASILGGRFMILKIHNLSFREYLFFNNIIPEDKFEYTEQRFIIMSHFREYLSTGAFPEVLHFENKRAYLSNLFQKVFYGDIMSRYQVRNDHGLKLLIKKIAESITDETSFTRIRNLIKSAGIDIGTATLIEYFNYLEENFLVYQLSNFALKFSERESKRKFYFIDNGFLNLFLFDSDDKLLENLVFNELKRNYSNGLFYYRDKNELDFYLPADKIAIQVTYSLLRPVTLNREISGITNMFKQLKPEKCIILTYNEELSLTDNPYGIIVMPVWKWLLKCEAAMD